METIFQKAAKGFSILFVLRIFSRIIDFVLHIVIIRDLDPHIYALTMHFGLLYNLILFYAKTCLKNSYQRRSLQVQNQDILNLSAQNLMFLGILATTIISIILGFVWSSFYSELHPKFNQVILLYCIAAIFECSVEPFIAENILKFDYSVQGKSELISVFLKTLVLFILSKTKLFDDLLNFGIAQISFSVMILGFTVFFSKKRNIKFQKIENKYYIDRQMKEMGIQFTILSFLKLLLQEVEKIIMINIKTNPIDQAEVLIFQFLTYINNKNFLILQFSLVSNLGSMLPRYIYAPIEEICYNVFAKLNSLQNQNQKIQKQQELLQRVLKLINIIGIFAITFGIILSESVIQTLYGEKWSIPSCIQSLQLYCVYEYVMGLNGISEAFVTGTINQNELGNYRYFVTCSTIFYVGLCFKLSSLGAYGLILANILSMIFRILICFYYIIKKIFDGKMALFFKFLQITFPKKIILLMIFIIFITVKFILNYFVQQFLKQLLISGGIISFLGVIILRDYKQDFKALLQQKNEKIE